MSFADPQSVTINAIAISLPRIASGVNQGAFRSPDSRTDLAVNHTYGRRVRRQIRLSVNKVAADPYIPATNQLVSMSTYLVVDTPVNGYTAAEAKLVIDGFLANLTASSGAQITRLLGGEN